MPAVLAVLLLLLLAAPRPAVAATTGPCLPGGSGPTCHFWKAKVLDVNDGDTVGVDVFGDGRRRHEDVRFSGVQTMELRRHDVRHPSGECHSVQPTLEVARLIRRSGGVVRLSAQDPSSHQGTRLRRWIAVRRDGRWQDLGALLVRRGQALWMGGQVEWAWNARYAELEQRAARAGEHLFDSSACGAGPQQDVPIQLWVQSDPVGEDHADGGEFVRVRNLSPTAALDLEGWWVRDASHLKFTFPRGTVLPPGVTTTLHVPRGRDWYADFFWGIDRLVFENASGDGRHLGGGAYLVDPDGDIRAYQQYPCVAVCWTPLQGKLAIAVAPRGGDERVAVANHSDAPADLTGLAVQVPGGLVPLDGIALAPGAFRVLQVPGVHRLPDDAGYVRVVTFSGVPVACTAWGGTRCP